MNLNGRQALEVFLENHLAKPLGAYGLDNKTMKKSFAPEKISAIYRSLITHSFGVWDMVE